MLRDFDEKRDFIRMALDCKIQCKDLASGETFYGHAHDLSGKGLSFDVDREFAPGARRGASGGRTQLQHRRADRRTQILKP